MHHCFNYKYICYFHNIPNHLFPSIKIHADYLCYNMKYASLLLIPKKTEIHIYKNTIILKNSPFYNIICTCSTHVLGERRVHSFSKCVFGRYPLPVCLTIFAPKSYASYQPNHLKNLRATMS